MNRLETKGLSIGYRVKGNENCLLGDLNLQLDQAQLVCLIGRNGTGKSTLIRTLAGLQDSLGGSILMGEKDLDSLNPRERARHMSLVLTHNSISGLMNVREVVTLGRYPHTNWFATMDQADRDKVEEAMRLTGVLELAENYYDQLSDGQQQKVIISRAVAQDTPLIVLDEPTNHLDIGNKAEILQLLQFLAHKQGKSILVSTHDLDLALQMADTLWVIAEGEMLSGPPEQLLLWGALDKAFPYAGIDLFSGKLLKPAGGMACFLKGDGKITDITRSALRRLNFRIVKDRTGADISIEISSSNKWIVMSGKDQKEIADIGELIDHLATLQQKHEVS